MSFFHPLICQIIKTMPKSYYAVANGRKTGIFNTWNECKAQVHQYPAAVYKKFGSELEANNFVNQYLGTKGQSSARKTFPTNPHKCQTLYPLGRKQTVSTKVSQVLSVPSRYASTSLDDDVPNEPPIKRRRTSSNKNSNRDNKDNFDIDENGYVNVYTDGACSSNGGKNARAGIGIWFGNEHPLNVSRPVDGRATNNMAEIQAVTVAAKQATNAGVKKLKINTDSKFLIKCITEWMPNWKRNGWKTSVNKPVINKEELLEMEKALAPLEINWNHIRGHVGIEGNEMADKLAKAGCSKY